MRLHNRFVLSSGERRVSADNTIDAAAVLDAVFAGQDFLSKIAVGAATGGSGTSLAAFLAEKPAVRTAVNYRAEAGLVFARVRAVFTDDDLAAGTFVAEAGFSRDGAGTCYNRAAFSGAYLQKEAGIDLVAEGTVYLEATGEGVALTCGENPLAAFLLGANPGLLHSAFKARLLPALPAAALSYPEGEEYPAAVTNRIFSAAVPSGKTAGGVVFFADGVPFLAFGRTETAEKTLSAEGYAEREECFAELVSVERDGAAIPQYQYALTSFLTSVTPCPLPAIPETAEFVTATNSLSLFRDGTTFSLWDTESGGLPQELPVLDLPAGDAAAVALSDTGTAFLLFDHAPYLAAYERTGNAYTRLTVTNAELFQGGTELYHPRRFDQLLVKLLENDVWHVKEYIYTIVNGVVSFRPWSDDAFQQPVLHVDPFSGARLYVDRATRTVKHRDNVGLTYIVADSVQELILKNDDVIADLKYLYVLQPALKVYRTFTGELITAEEEDGLYKTVVSPMLDCLLRLYADNTFEIVCIDTAAGSLRVTGRGRTAGKVRSVRFLGDAVLFYENGAEPECFLRYGRGFSLKILDGGNADVTYTERRAVVGGINAEVGVWSESI